MSHLVVVLDAVVGFVDPSLPLRVVVGEQRALVTAGDPDETTVFPVHSLDSGPCTHDTIGGSEWKVVEILVQRMP